MYLVKSVEIFELFVEKIRFGDSGRRKKANKDYKNSFSYLLKNKNPWHLSKFLVQRILLINCDIDIKFIWLLPLREGSLSIKGCTVCIVYSIARLDLSFNKFLHRTLKIHHEDYSSAEISKVGEIILKYIFRQVLVNFREYLFLLLYLLCFVLCQICVYWKEIRRKKDYYPTVKKKG